MIRFLAAGIFAASCLAALFVLSGATTNEAQSTPSTPASLKGDRLDARPYGQTCSQAAWPYYEAHCLRNTVGATRAAQPVRIVTTDRLQKNP